MRVAVERGKGREEKHRWRRRGREESKRGTEVGAARYVGKGGGLGGNGEREDGREA
jgi:hypothetical protein